jgi:hypothetical protein
MDLGYPYTEQEIADRAVRFKDLRRHLLYCRSVPDAKYNNLSSNNNNQSNNNLSSNNNNQSYTVEYISSRNTRKVKRLKQYLVKWENYDEPTWQFEYVLIQDLGKEVFAKLLV